MDSSKARLFNNHFGALKIFSPIYLPVESNEEVKNRSIAQPIPR
jgi:hypothetical protein